MKDYLLSNNRQKTINEHPSWLSAGDHRRGKIPKPTFLEDLDDIPPINYSLVDISKYSGRISSKDGIEKFTLPIHSTRGCPYNCIFCCSAANHGRRIRCMSAKRFISRYMIEKY